MHIELWRSSSGRKLAEHVQDSELMHAQHHTPLETFYKYDFYKKNIIHTMPADSGSSSQLLRSVNKKDWEFWATVSLRLAWATRRKPVSIYGGSWETEHLSGIKGPSSRRRAIFLGVLMQVCLKSIIFILEKTRIFLYLIMKIFIFKFFTINTFSTCPILIWEVSTLNHKLLNNCRKGIWL